MADARKLSSMDASFLYLETPEMPMHVGSMAIFRLPENYNGNFFEDFKAMIASRLHIAPILKARLEKAPLDIDHPSWVEDDQFDIDRHIFRGSLPAPPRATRWQSACLRPASRASAVRPESASGNQVPGCRRRRVPIHRRRRDRPGANA